MKKIVKKMKNVFEKLYDHDVSLYERFWRRCVIKDPICRGGYIVMLTRMRYWYLNKYEPEWLEELGVKSDRVLEIIDQDDCSEITYMLGATINTPGIRCYVEYTSGRRRRIKLGAFGRRHG